MQDFETFETAAYKKVRKKKKRLIVMRSIDVLSILKRGFSIMKGQRQNLNFVGYYYLKEISSQK